MESSNKQNIVAKTTSPSSIHIVTENPQSANKAESIMFVMPAYNEEANIADVVTQWYPVIDRLNEEGVNASLVIADDGSKDQTWSMMQQLATSHPHFHPQTKANSGHGATILHLYRHAIDNNVDYIFQTDSDGQTDPDEFWRFWKNRQNYDLQVGHRSSREDGISRVFVTKVLKGVVWLTFHVNVTDANTPFRLMRTKSIKPILDIIPRDFFLSNVALSAIAVKKGLKTLWLPITFKPRQGGVNSINMKRIFKIGRKAVRDFIVLNRSVSCDTENES